MRKNFLVTGLLVLTILPSLSLPAWADSGISTREDHDSADIDSESPAPKAGPANPKLSPEQVQSLQAQLDKLKETYSAAEKDLNEAKKEHDGRVAVKARNYSAVVAGFGAFAMVMNTTEGTYVPPQAKIGAALFAGGGAVALGSGLYVHFTSQEYDAAKAKLSDLGQKLKDVQAKLDAN